MNHTKRTLLCAALFAASPLALSQATAGEAAASPVTVLGAPQIILDAGAIHAGPSVVSFDTLTIVRLIDSRGELVLERRAHGAPITVYLSELNLADGEYAYEVVNVLVREDAAISFTAPVGNSQSKGRINVEGGQIVKPSRAGFDNASTLNAPSLPVRMLGWVLDALIADAAAQDVDTSPGGQITTEDSLPGVYFHYGPDDGLEDGILRWAMEGAHWDGASNRFQIFDWFNDILTPAIRIDTGTTTQSIFVESSGDMQLANNAVRIERSTGRMSIGPEQAQLGAMDINASGFATLALRDTLGGGFTGLQYHANQFGIFSNQANRPFAIEENAPSNMMHMSVGGDIGLGTSVPSQQLHLRRTDGSAQILVEEANVTLAPRTLFKLSNAGNTKFEIEETSTANTWAFTNSGFDFRVSLQGSGVVEFLVDNSGNASLEGTLTENSDVNDKQAIVPIDEQYILDKVTQLPVTQWQYKDTAGVNHIGPMAQDFHAAFGLGATDTGISTIDTGGVALASIKALAQRNEQLQDRNSALEQRVQELEKQLKRMDVLEAAVIALGEQVLAPVQVSNTTH